MERFLAFAPVVALTLLSALGLIRSGWFLLPLLAFGELARRMQENNGQLTSS